LCALAWASCVCGRVGHARASGASGRSAPRGKESQPRRSVWRVGLVGSVAKRFGPVCDGVSAAAVVRACRQIRQSLARQVSLGAAEKVNDFASAHRMCLVGQRARRRMTLARKPGCHRLPPGCCPGSGLPHRSGESKKLAGVGLLAGAVSSATPRSGLAPTASRSLLQICSGVQRNSPRLSVASIARRGEESQPRRLCLSGVVRRQQVAKQQLSLCGRAWYSTFTACPESLQRLGVFATAPRSQPNFHPLFSSSARSAPMQWANICAQRDGLIARGGSSATRKRALRSSAEVGPLTRPPLAQGVSRGFQFR